MNCSIRIDTRNGYRYGFNGKEHDPEWNGVGAMYDYGFRIYDPRIAKFLSVDPLSSKYPMITPYQYACNTPIMAIDVDGLEASVSTTLRNDGTALIEITLDVMIVDNSNQGDVKRQANNRNIKTQTENTYAVTDANGNTYITKVNYVRGATLTMEYTSQVVNKVTGIAEPEGTYGQVGDAAGNYIGNTQVNTIQILAGTASTDAGMTDFDTKKTGPHELGHVFGLRHPYRPMVESTLTTSGVDERGDEESLELEVNSPNNIMMQSSVSRFGVSAKVSQLETAVTNISIETGVYGVKKGDTLLGIAERFKTTTTDLQELNPKITDPWQIKVGQTIKLK